MKRPRIGLCDLNEHFSGLTRYCSSLLSNIDFEEFDVCVYCRPNGPYLAKPGIHLIYQPTTSTPENEFPFAGPKANRIRWKVAVRNIWRKWSPEALRLWVGFGRESFELARTFRQRPVDLLHVQTVNCDEAVVGAWWARTPRILSTWHIDSTQSNRKEWILELLTHHCLDRAIAVSQATKTDWVKRCRVRPDRVTVIPNAVDPNRYKRQWSRIEARNHLGLAGENWLVLAGIGRLAIQKGFEYLLQAVAQLTGEYPRLHLVLAGDGPLRETLTKQASDLGISEEVHFIGFCSDVQPVLDAADIFVLPSLWEALPYSLLEAMAASLPVVGTRVAGVPEVILHQVTGFLVPSQDGHALAAALRPLLNSPELRSRMGHAARDRVVRHFNEKDTIQQTLRIYRDLLKDFRKA